MERQIKFRAKDTFKSEFFPQRWLYGTPVQDGDDVWMCVKKEDKGIVSVKVDPSTVGQFTGLTDCNGKEIYEGDILGIPEDVDFAPERVIFKEGCFKAQDDYTAIAMNSIDTEYRTIIGNIHDNPELIKTERK